MAIDRWLRIALGAGSSGLQSEIDIIFEMLFKWKIKIFFLKDMK